MSERLSKIKNKRQFGSFLMVCVLVAASLVTIIPLTAPNVKAQIYHLASTGLEDNISPYDINMNPTIIEWTDTEPHIIDNMFGYTVESGHILIIPGSVSVTFESPGMRLDVNAGGTLLTTNDGSPFTWTTFTSAGFWNGIYFLSGSQGRIVDSTFENALVGVYFEKGSVVMSPGINDCKFRNYQGSGLTLEGAVGDTNAQNVEFDVQAAPSGTGLTLMDGSLNVTGNSIFTSHGPNEPAAYVKNGSLLLDGTSFDGDSQPGNCVYIDEKSNGTVLNNVYFERGGVGDHYVRVDGSSPLIENSTFVTDGGELSVIANDDTNGVPGAPFVRQPSAENFPGLWDDSFDNSTLNATGSSSVELQWYMDVYVDDPDGNPIDNVAVTVVDRLGNPSSPPVKITDINGWAKWFTVTELMLYSASIDYFNPFNVSAVNASETGYAIPEPGLNMSEIVTLTVPFSLIPNAPPTVAITPITAGQSGPVLIQYILTDPDIWDVGNLSVEVFYSTDGIGWRPCTQAGGDGTTFLSANILYNFIWDSSADEPDMFYPTVYIQIIPSDKGGAGTPSQIGPFELDNLAPNFLTGPTTTPSNITALVEWTVSESADAAVWWGIWVNGDVTDLTTETAGNLGSTDQFVTLTGLLPGRKYTFAINSTDPFGNKHSSALDSPPDNFYVFGTQVHIPLYTGWNMISLPPYIPDTRVEFVFASLAGQFDIIQVYDAVEYMDPWKQYIPGKPVGNDLENIFHELGVWIHMLNDVVFIPDQIIPDPPVPPATDPMAYLVFGWNFAGYHSSLTRTVDSALAGISYDMVQTYDAASGTWYSYDGTSGDLEVMEMGRGYWIHCLAGVGQDWTLSYI